MRVFLTVSKIAQAINLAESEAKPESDNFDGSDKKKK